MAGLSEEEARAVLGDDVLGAAELARVFGAMPAAALNEPIPFTSDDVVAAHGAGEMLVLRVPRASDQAPLTLLQMIQRFPDAFDPKFLRQMGYQLKDDWGIEIEPLAATETCAPGWALVRKQILDESRNITFDEQDAVVRRYAERIGASQQVVRRRSAVETVYDTLLYLGARGTRLLENTWDWSGSRTIDGGYLNVGGFGARGIQILSFSRPVRHGNLGVCPMRRRG